MARNNGEWKQKYGEFMQAAISGLAANPNFPEDRASYRSDAIAAEASSIAANAADEFMRTKLRVERAEEEGPRFSR
ncbi:hypothetical protein [Thioalkalivibrio sp. ALMg11]|uniref:hypothetical protein n=1 Tax=Thioalkalivibrio sp. ALMg11 TaxID=1158165 RepID=UPI00036D93CA|nr:hypothetical protein [Thioalkalivibrio sp. ALMg11]